MPEAQTSFRMTAFSGKGENSMTTEDRLENIERLLAQLVTKTLVKSWYTVEEFATLVGRSNFTCREWCRLGRIHAEKSMTQSGATTTWTISQEEYLRYQREGLLPLRGLAATAYPKTCRMAAS